MKRVVLAVHDRQANCYGQPMFVAAIGVGVRSFTGEVNRADINNQLYTNPEDFILFKIGEYDDQTGQITACEPEQVAIASNVRVRE